MSPYIEEQLRVHYQVYKSKSPFVQIDLDEANARKVVRSFQGRHQEAQQLQAFHLGR
jgi:hypothetical protein